MMGFVDSTFDRTFDGTFDGTFDQTFDRIFDGIFDGTLNGTFENLRRRQYFLYHRAQFILYLVQTCVYVYTHV